ncbi:MAG: response regulator [Deltaproteobacteria bacterium]|nr:response regulator [Deltaproteobacteria bacterium]MBN2670315.1 response regulator [Deltaproteobacteria bacterium]
MNECTNCSKLQKEIEYQKQRIDRIAKEKSHLQLVADILSDLAKLHGVKAIANHTLAFLMNSIGGTNLSFYYTTDKSWQMIDVYGNEKEMTYPEDPDVLRAIDEKKFHGIQTQGEEKGYFTFNVGKSRFEKWVFPLCVEEEVFGAFVVDGLLIHLHDAIIEQLHIISTYISLVVKNEFLTESRLKKANDALIQKNIALMNEIDQRTRLEREREKLYQELQQAQKMEAIGTLAGGIAHDFNNLLGAIIGYTDLAIDNCTDDESHFNLDQVMQAAERARDLVKQILTFSRKQDTKNAPIYIAPVVKEVMKLLRATIPTTIIIQVSIDKQCGAILGNVTQLHQIIMNLCTNATHAMEENGGTLRVSLRPIEPQNKKGEKSLQLQISDTGCGIPQDVLPRIFEPYFTTKGIGKGTGMGLAVVHGIVLSMNGTITVSSELGKGTTIECTFPIVDGDVRDSEPPVEQHPTFTGVAMIVDDESSIADLAQQMLTKMGFTCETFQNGMNALDAFRADPKKYTLVLTDQTMPGITGMQLSEKLFSIKNVPVLISSGYSTSIDEEKVAAQPNMEFLAKPYTYKKLEKVISDLLSDSP